MIDKTPGKGKCRERRQFDVDDGCELYGDSERGAHQRLWPDDRERFLLAMPLAVMVIDAIDEPSESLRLAL